jgi:hypothetical protein
MYLPFERLELFFDLFRPFKFFEFLLERGLAPLKSAIDYYLYPFSYPPQQLTATSDQALTSPARSDAPDQ